MTAINLPASKSISNRALIIQAVNPEIIVQNLSTAEDTVNLQKALNQLKEGNSKIFTGEGGTTFRFFLAYAATQKKNIIIEGSEHLNNRPVKPLLKALESLGARFEYLKTPYKPPLKIITPVNLNKEKVEIDASESSQFLSAMLLIAPLFKNGLLIQTNEKIASESYVRMTLHLMQFFDVEVSVDEQVFKIPKKQYASKQILVENDWSSATYWWITAFLLPYKKIRLKQLPLPSFQPDASIVELLKAYIEFVPDGKDLIIWKKPDAPNSAYKIFGCENCPDLIPSLAVFCAVAQMPCKITGTKTLYKKESNRVKALKNELNKIGVKVKELSENELEIIPPPKLVLTHPKINTYNDHRIAMAFAPLKILFPTLEIENPSTVNKSFPNFWNEFNKMFNVE